MSDTTAPPTAAHLRGIYTTELASLPRMLKRHGTWQLGDVHLKLPADPFIQQMVRVMGAVVIDVSRTVLHSGGPRMVEAAAALAREFDAEVWLAFQPYPQQRYHPHEGPHYADPSDFGVEHLAELTLLGDSLRTTLRILAEHGYTTPPPVCCFDSERFNVAGAVGANGTVSARTWHADAITAKHAALAWIVRDMLPAAYLDWWERGDADPEPFKGLGTWFPKRFTTGLEPAGGPGDDNRALSLSLNNLPDQGHTREQIVRALSNNNGRGPVMAWVGLGAGTRPDIEAKAVAYDRRWDYADVYAWDMGYFVNRVAAQPWAEIKRAATTSDPPRTADNLEMDFSHPYYRHLVVYCMGAANVRRKLEL